MWSLGFIQGLRLRFRVLGFRLSGVEAEFRVYERGNPHCYCLKIKLIVASLEVGLVRGLRITCSEAQPHFLDSGLQDRAQGPRLKAARVALQSSSQVSSRSDRVQP